MTNPNYDRLILRTKLSPSDLEILKDAISNEYPADPMMQELRLVPTLHSITDGRTALEDILSEMHDGASRSHRIQ